MAVEDDAGLYADHAGGKDVFAAALDEGYAAHRPRIGHPARERDGGDKNDVGEKRVFARGKRRAKNAVDEERKENRREGKHDVADAHDEAFNPPARKACKEAERNA